MTNLHERIQQYLDGELKGEELHDFESQLKVDESLSKELALVRKVREAVDFGQNIKEKEDRLQGTLTELGTTYFDEVSVGKGGGKVRPIRRLLAVAASILLPLGILLSLWSTYFLEQMPYKNYAEFPVPGTMGTQSTEEGFRLYKEEKYIEALAVFDKMENTNDYYYKALALKGEILFKYKKQNKKASKLFDDILTKYQLENNDFKERLEWNRLITILNGSNMPSAYIQEILNNEQHKFYQNAHRTIGLIQRYNYLKWASYICVFLGLISLIFFFAKEKLGEQSKRP